MKKRLLSWIMVVCMLVTLMPTNVLAAAAAQDGDDLWGAQQESPITHASSADVTSENSQVEAVSATPTESAAPTEAPTPTESTAPTDSLIPSGDAAPTEPEIPEVILSEAATAVRAQIAALPTMDQWNAMTLEEQNNAGLAAYAASDAYDALSEEDKAALAEDYQVLMNLFQVMNGMVSGYDLTGALEQGDNTIAVTPANGDDTATRYYTELYLAINDINTVGGGTITLLGDVTENSNQYLTIRKTTTLDLAGYSLHLEKTTIDVGALSGQEEETITFTVKDTGRETTDGTVYGELSGAQGVNAISVANNIAKKRVVIDGATVICDSETSAIVYSAPGTTLIENSDLEDDFDIVIKGNAKIASQGNCISSSSASVMVEGGTMESTGYSYAAIHAKCIFVKGGTLKGRTVIRGAGANNGWIRITDGIVESITTEQSGAIVTEGGKIFIEGGTFSASNTSNKQMRFSGDEMTISGGDFQDKISAWINGSNAKINGLLANGYSYYTKGESLWTENTYTDETISEGPVVVDFAPAYTPSPAGTDGWYSAANLPVLTAGSGWDGIATTADGPFDSTVTVEEETSAEGGSTEVYLCKNIGTTAEPNYITVKAADFTYKLDKTAPVWSDVDLGDDFSTDGEWIYSNKSLTVKMTIADGNEGSTINEVEYYLRDMTLETESEENWQTALRSDETYDFTIPMGYKGRVFVRATDGAGNESLYALSASGIVKLDNSDSMQSVGGGVIVLSEAPEFDFIFNNTKLDNEYSSPNYITQIDIYDTKVQYTEDLGVFVKSTTIRVDDGEEMRLSGGGSQWGFSQLGQVFQEGMHTYYITSTDYADNTRTQSYTLNVDTIKPEPQDFEVKGVSYAAQGNGTYTVTLKMESNEIAKFYWNMTGAPTESNNVVSATGDATEIEIPDCVANIPKTIYINAVDEAGNVSTYSKMWKATVPAATDRLLTVDTSALKEQGLMPIITFTKDGTADSSGIQSAAYSDTQSVYNIQQNGTYKISIKEHPEYTLNVTGSELVSDNAFTVTDNTASSIHVKLTVTLKEGDIWVGKKNNNNVWTLLPSGSTSADFDALSDDAVNMGSISSSLSGRNVHLVGTDCRLLIEDDLTIGAVIGEGDESSRKLTLGQYYDPQTVGIKTLTVTGNIVDGLSLMIPNASIDIQKDIAIKDMTIGDEGKYDRSYTGHAKFKNVQATGNIDICVGTGGSVIVDGTFTSAGDMLKVREGSDFTVTGRLTAKAGELFTGTYGGVTNTTESKTPSDLLGSDLAYYVDGSYVDGAETIDQKVTVEPFKALSITKTNGAVAEYIDVFNAIQDAQKLENRNCTLKLLGNITMAGTRLGIYQGAFTIDLNGMTWKNSGNENSSLLNIEGGKVTFTDSGTGGRIGKSGDTTDAIQVGENGIVSFAGGTYGRIYRNDKAITFAQMLSTGYGYYHLATDTKEAYWATQEELTGVDLWNVTIKKIQSITEATLAETTTYNTANFSVTLDSADANTATEIEGVVYAAGTVVADPFADTTSAITFTGSIAKDTTSGTVTCPGLTRNTNYDAYIRIKGGYAGQTATKVTFVTAKESLEGKVTLDLGTGVTGYTYTGVSQIPAVKLGETDITNDTDHFTIQYSRAQGDTTSQELMTTNAGTITVEVTAKETADYTGSVSQTYTIAQATPTVTWDTTAQTQSKEYTGSPVTDIAEPTIGLKNNETAHGTLSYEYQLTTANPATDAWEKGLPTDPLAGTGTYKVRATVAATPNYDKVTGDTYMTLTITKKKVAVTIGGVEKYTYTGTAGYTAHTAAYKDVTGADVTIPVQYSSTAYTASQTKPTVVGTYTLTPVMPADAFYEVDTTQVTGVTSFKIEKAVPVITENPLDRYDRTQTYTSGQIQAPTNAQFMETNADVSAPEYTFTWYTGQNADGSVTGLTSLAGTDRPVATGEYTLQMGLPESANFNAASNTFPVTVSYLSTTDSASLATTNEGEEDWYHGDVTVNAPVSILTSYQISTQNTSADAANWKDSLTISADMNGNYTYYLKNADGEITDAKTITVKRDTAVPKITKIENDTTKSLFDWIFHNGQIKVTVTASDNSSGVHHLGWAAGSQGSENVAMTDGVGSFYIDKDYKGLPTVTVYDTAGNTVTGRVNGSAADVTDTEGGVIAEDQKPTVELKRDDVDFVESTNSAVDYKPGDPISVKVTDNGTADSGVAKITYQLDQGTVTTLWEAEAADGNLVYTVDKDRADHALQFTLSSGQHTYTVTATDNAGNVTTERRTVLVDKEAPEITENSIQFTDISFYTTKISFSFTDEVPTYPASVFIYAYPAGTVVAEEEMGHEGCGYGQATIQEGTAFSNVEIGVPSRYTAYDVYLKIRDGHNNKSKYTKIENAFTSTKEPLNLWRYVDIAGVPAVGEVLSIASGFVEPADGGTITYTWSRTKNGKTEELGKGKTYTVTQEDVGAAITLRVSAEKEYSDAVCTKAVEKSIGWKKIEGQWHYLNGAGRSLTGWQTIYGKRYYFKTNGVMAWGWQKISGNWYYMSNSANDGSMKTGWQKIGGKWYYFGSSKDGAMKIGWQKVSSKWYYMYSPSGQMAANTWIGRYFVNTSGVWVSTR